MKKLDLKSIRNDIKILLIAFSFLTVILISFNGLNLDVLKLDKLEKNIESTNKTDDLFQNHSIKHINEFRIEIDKEYLLGLEALLPKKEKCLKVRYKYVPLKKISIDNIYPDGKAFVRLRGYCDTHWYSKQKSLKIRLKSDQLFGYKTFNLNAMTTDPMLFDKFYGDLLAKNGGISSKIKFVKLYINGEYNGLRQLVQNLDDQLIQNNDLELGSIYRERTQANFGDDLPLWKLKTIWKRNSANRAPKWHDLRELQREIKKSVLNKSLEFKSVFDEEMYLRYLAILTISGTDNMGTHNIPIYRPSSSKKFKPIGYDFSIQKNPIPLEGLNFNHLQNNYINWNWLSSLYWKDVEFRKKFYNMVSTLLIKEKFLEDYNKILNSIEPIIKKEINQKYTYNEYKSFEDIRKNGNLRLYSRISYLREMLLKPEVLINDNWKNKKKFQFLINGLGLYKLNVKINKIKCSDKSSGSMLLNTQTTKTFELLRCKNGYFSTNPVILERNDIPEPNLNNNKTIRNSLGGILVDVKYSGNIKIDDITIESLQTSELLSLNQIWPFNIEKKTDNLVYLGKNLKFDNDFFSNEINNSYKFFNLNVNKFYNFNQFNEKNNSFFTLSRMNTASIWSPQEFGPLLCWSLSKNTNSSKKSKGCFEFHTEWFNTFELEASSKKIKSIYDYKITNQDIKNCKTFKFNKGKYLITEALVFPDKCILEFEEGANLFFNPGVYLVINYKYQFPTGDKKVFLRKAKNDPWGGIIINYKGQNLVSNLYLSGSGEFFYKGKRYVGGLTLDNIPKSKVTKSIFIDNYADDALNVVGGESEISYNYFFRNRDGLDLDLGKAKVYYNYFLNNKDDAIDLGSVNLVDIFNNIIIGSGDKGVSVGEKSITNITQNVIKKNSIGVAVKDGSRALIDENNFIENYIAKSFFDKVTLKNNKKRENKNIVSGANYYFKNDFKAKNNLIETKISALNLTEILIRKNIEENILSVFKLECVKCLSQ